jgi:hypothetical protein
MKIIENTKEVKPITFADLEVGDVFKLSKDTNYYMKTQKFCFEEYDYLFDSPYMDYRNTVCLSNGRIMKTQKTTEVIPVDCELIIK